MKTKLIHSYSTSNLSAAGLQIEEHVESNNSLDLTSDIPTISQKSYTIKNKIHNPITHYIHGLSNRIFKKKILVRKFPLLNWIHEYSMKIFIADFIAGITVGLTVLPQGLAYATIAGLPPQYGLYSGFVGCFVYIALGSTRAVTIGPTAALSIITLTYTSGKPPEAVILLCFITGIITLIMGIFQLGFIVNFISTPVISGFTSAMAITICSTQLRALLGLNFPGDGFIDIIYGLVEHIGDLRVADTLLSVICVTVLILLYKIQIIVRCFIKNIPAGLDKMLWFVSVSRNAIIVLVCTITFNFLGEPCSVKITGNIESGFPKFKIPSFSYFQNSTVPGEVNEFTLGYFIKENKLALFVVPLLSILEHITSAKVMVGTSRTDASQEMITIGLSNLIGSFFSSMPVTGSFSRTSVNISSGVKTPLGGLITGTLVILALSFLTPYFHYIPNATLGAVIINSVILMVDFRIILPMWKSKKMDLIPWTITFFVGLLVHLEYGIVFGLIISIVYLLYYAALPGIRVKKAETTSGLEFIIVELDRSLIFPSVEYTKYTIMKSGVNWGMNQFPVVIDCQHIQFADYTAAQGIQSMFIIFNEKPQQLILWNLKPSVLKIVTGVMECNGVPFNHCSTENELEALIETKYVHVEI